MRKIKLNNTNRTKHYNAGFVSLVDDEDFDKVNEIKWQAKKHGQTVYARGLVVVNGIKKSVYMHRYLLSVYDKTIEVDHMDNNGLNNQKINLRQCTHLLNGKNRSVNINKKTKYKGVTLQRPGTFQVRITLNKKQIQLGYFKNELDAAKAYNNAAIKYHGEFAKLNTFPIHQKIH